MFLIITSYKKKNKLILLKYILVNKFKNNKQHT